MLKHVLLPDHVPVNKWKLKVLGLIPLTFVKQSGIEEAIKRVELPDGTASSGGRTDPFDFEVEIPMHHTLERVAMEGWYTEGKDPVSPTYKKTGTLTHFSNSRLTTVSYTIYQMWLFNRTLPDLDLENDGELATVKFNASGDDLIPIT